MTPVSLILAILVVPPSTLASVQSVFRRPPETSDDSPDNSIKSSAENSANGSIVGPLLKLWSDTYDGRRTLAIMFEDRRRHETRIPRGVFEEFSMATRLVSVGSDDTLSRIDPTMEANNCVLLLFFDIAELRRLVVSPYLRRIWHPGNMYVLRQTNVRPANSTDRKAYRFVRWALERLWRYRRVDKVVVSIGNEYIRYDPFALNKQFNWMTGENGDHHHHHRYHHSWSDHDPREGLFVDNPDSLRNQHNGLYILEKRKQFNGYPLTISIFESETMVRAGRAYDGVDGRFMKEICRAMNVTPVFLKARGGSGFSMDDVYVSAIADVAYGRADAAFNEFFVKDYAASGFEMLTYYTADHLCILVPRASTVPDHLLLFRIFSPRLWAVIAAVYIAVSVVYGEMRRAGTGGTTRRNRVGSVTKANVKYLHKEPSQMYLPNVVPAERTNQAQRCFHVICFFSLTKLVAKPFLHLVEPLDLHSKRCSERLVLISSLVMGVVLNGIFMSKLTARLGGVAYFDDIHTLEDLDKSGLPILTNWADLIDDVLLDDDHTSVVWRLRKKLQFVNESELQRRLYEFKDAAVFRRKGYMQLHIDNEKRNEIHLVEECPKFYTTAPLLTKGSIFQSRVNEIIGRLHYGGFYHKWFSAMADRQWEHREDTHHSFRRINLRHLLIPFLILFIGLTSSLITFAYECREYSE